MQLGHHSGLGQMDELGRMDSPIHRLDARIKALTTAAFIVAVMSFPRYEVSALMPFFLYPFALVAVGRIPPGFILRKLLLAAPFALAVGLCNPLLDREPMTWIGTWPISGGWLSFASITVRFSLTVSAALTLVAVTGIHRLCAGLEQLGLPQVFTVQVQLLCRYLFVLSDEGLRLLRGVEVRSAERHRHLAFRTYASLTGHLLLRAMDRAQRIHQAMASRGFDGHVRVLQPGTIHAIDIVFLAAWTAFFAAARLWPMARWLGEILTGAST